MHLKLGCSDSTLSSEVILSYSISVPISQFLAPSNSANTAIFWSCAVNLDFFKKKRKEKGKKTECKSSDVYHVPYLVDSTIQLMCFSTGGDVATQKWQEVAKVSASVLPLKTTTIKPCP